MQKHRQSVHFIGMCGSAMASIAKMMRDLGWEVTGSDYQCHPPVSDYLKEKGLLIKIGFSPENIPQNTRVVVVNKNVSLDNPEYLEAKNRSLVIWSRTDVLKKFVKKKNSILICGTYGKTTIAALVNWILEKAGFNPSFMIGGVSLDFPDNVRATDSNWSCMEGDEYPAADFDPVPKILHYSPRYALISAAKWDHADFFKTEKDYVTTFTKFVQQIHPKGLLVACLDGENVAEVIKQAKCKVVKYSVRKKADYDAKEIHFRGSKTSFSVFKKGKRLLELKTKLLGSHNVENILGAVALASELNISPEVISEALGSFYGVRRRLEMRAKVRGITVIDDLGHSPTKAQATLKALRLHFPKNKIFAVFDPHTVSLQQKKTLPWYRGAFDLADQVIIPKVRVRKDTPPQDRVMGKDIIRAIKSTQPKVEYIPKDEVLIENLVRNVKGGDIIVFLSSGGLRGIIEKTIAKLGIRSTIESGSF